MENKTENSNGNVLAGFVLLTDANMDWPRFRHYLKEDWGITPQDEVKDNAIVFETDGMIAACSLMPNPVPNHEAEENAKNNILWRDGVKEVAKHGAHVMVAVMNKKSSIEQSVLFAKIASSLLKLKNTIGIYKNPTVYEKNFYVQAAEAMKQDELPIPIMVYVGMYITKDGLLCGYTSGLRYFGYEEIEVVDTPVQPEELYRFLLAISDYVISADVHLKDGETIGFTDEQKLPITLSDGVSVEGQTLKIALS